MKKTLCCAAVVVVSVAGLAGCAGVTTDVQVSGTPVVLQSERTYAIVQTPSQETGAAREQYEALIHSELGNYGLVDRAAEHANYMLSLAYDTRPAAVGVIAGDCADSACNGVAKSGFSLFGREYQHSMTLRLFDAATGKEVYKVTATSHDRNADALHPIPWLVKSAFAQFPFAGYGSWRVKLRNGEAAGRPEVVTVKQIDK